MVKIILMFSCFVTIILQSFADGKMYSAEHVPPDIPYQRALIIFKDSRETLILQSKYEMGNRKDMPSSKMIGWVVPVPSIPELASMDVSYANDMFRLLAFLCKPRNIKLADFTMIASFVIMVILIILYIASLCNLLPDYFYRKRCVDIRNCMLLVILILFLEMLIMPALSSAKLGSDIEVISSQTVGIYDTKIIRAGHADDLIEWLNENHFSFNDRDRLIFQNYIDKGWCFTVAKINPYNSSTTLRSWDGLVAPLILRFQAENPIYPLSLTGSGGYKTKILIYTISDRKMTSDGRIKLRFAGVRSLNNIEQMVKFTKPENFFVKDHLSVYYLCKFMDTLTPEQMKQDIVFKPANNNEPYRELVIGF